MEKTKARAPGRKANGRAAYDFASWVAGYQAGHEWQAGDSPRGHDAASWRAGWLEAHSQLAIGEAVSCTGKAGRLAVAGTRYGGVSTRAYTNGFVTGLQFALRQSWR